MPMIQEPSNLTRHATHAKEYLMSQLMSHLNDKEIKIGYCTASKCHNCYKNVITSPKRSVVDNEVIEWRGRQLEDNDNKRGVLWFNGYR